MTCFYFLFSFFFNFFLLRINCIVEVDSFVDTSSLNLTNINTILLADNGASVYISFINGSTYIINKYSILNGIPTYVNSFIDPSNRVNADKMFIYSSYLIAYQTTGVSFNAFYISNFTLYLNFLMSENILEFRFVSTKGIILYITTSGYLKYILQSNFLASNANVIIALQNYNPLRMSVSPDQVYVAITCTTTIYTWVYQLNTYSSVLTFTSNNNGVSGMVWRSGTQLILFTQYNCIIYRITIPSGTYNTTTIMIVPTCSNVGAMTLYLSNLVYLATDQIVGAANYLYDPLHTGLFSYNFQILQITYFWNISVIRPTSYTNQIDNTLLFANNNATNLYFGSMLLFCPSPLVYNMSIAQCVNITSPTSSINSTNTTSPTNSTNSTSQTNLVNTTNSTNSTNTANQTIFTNQTNFSSTSNVTNSLNLTFVQADPIIQTFQSFVNGTLRSQSLVLMNSVPGSRTVLRPVFTFFVNFDDLWLYVYHQRQYDAVVNQVFNSVQSLESEKWNCLPIHTIWKFLGLQSDNTINQFSSKLNRTSYKFYEIQQNSNGFIVNTLTFLCSNVFIMLAMFIFFRMLFYLLFNYRISVIFRNYSFWLYFLMIILEGNLQYLTYLFSFELQNFFSVDYINKFGLAFASIVFFVLFIFSVTAYPIVQYYHGRLVRYFAQNMKLSEFTAIYMAMQMGYRNALLGFLHSVLDQYYLIKIGSLITVQIIYLLITLILLSKQMIFQNHLKVWVNIMATILRILLILTFFIDYENTQIDFKFIHVQIFYFYSYEMYLAVFVQCIRLLVQIKKWIFNQKTPKSIDEENSSYKQQLDIKKYVYKKQKNQLKIMFIDQNGLIFDSDLDKTVNKYSLTKDICQKQSNIVNLKLKQITKKIINIKYKRDKTSKGLTNITIVKYPQQVTQSDFEETNTFQPMRQKNNPLKKSIAITKYKTQNIDICKSD